MYNAQLVLLLVAGFISKYPQTLYFTAIVAILAGFTSYWLTHLGDK